jgi:hypothetical protein
MIPFWLGVITIEFDGRDGILEETHNLSATRLFLGLASDRCVFGVVAGARTPVLGKNFWIPRKL